MHRRPRRSIGIKGHFGKQDREIERQKKTFSPFQKGCHRIYLFYCPEFSVARHLCVLADTLQSVLEFLQVEHDRTKEDLSWFG